MTDKLYEYAVSLRRKLHEYPEIGFDLPKTTALVTSELAGMGIGYSCDFGVGSVVAELGNGDRLIALRADMDALPINEKTDLPYKSKNPGKMHACGHDAHTAILLATARYLKENESKLKCRVRLIFQPSEECAVSGAKMLVDNGVMEGVSQIICTHCENTIPAGAIGICRGDYMAACIPATIRFIGRTSHATLPQFGADANAMAVDAYVEMKKMVIEEAKDLPYIWSVGRIAGGKVHNVISDLCEMDISFRFYDMDFAARVGKKVKEICTESAKRYGGSVEIVWNMSVGPVYNDGKIVDFFEETVKNEGIAIQPTPQKMSSEDFGWYLTKAPGMLFRFGTGSGSDSDRTVAHNSDFCIDEKGMQSAIRAFCAYVMNY